MVGEPDIASTKCKGNLNGWMPKPSKNPRWGQAVFSGGRTVSTVSNVTIKVAFATKQPKLVYSSIELVVYNSGAAGGGSTGAAVLRVPIAANVTFGQIKCPGFLTLAPKPVAGYPAGITEATWPTWKIAGVRINMGPGNKKPKTSIDAVGLNLK
ncbi:hypothetical protein HYH02_004372 [Chlamydomonas schloesseri]|uniref:Vegetative cell wall HRGP n=1 Tax=Chlamydomonas schloesseri TaxID=2026947 RepID=A0A836B9D9_9CHLO|nr:hypothetical protein HYH02_004372 [Chlamydomonas schloesseri]|eukprot:KAG2451104.1 hypothetical protein HYH02_004372 [Chlamydomonas schloesseri]